MIQHLPPPDIYDPVVEAHKRDVDRTLLRENVRLTPAERIRKSEQFTLEFEQRRGIALRKPKN